jgi:hypothetical protein
MANLAGRNSGGAMVPKEHRGPSYRWLVTSTCRQYSRTGRVEHFGDLPVQMYLPNGTTSRLISTSYFRGSICSSASIVCFSVRAENAPPLVRDPTDLDIDRD